MRKSSLPCAECARSVLVMHIFVWCLERCPICWVVVVVDPVEATIKSENGCICIYATVDEEPFQIFKTASRTISTLRKLMLTKNLSKLLDSNHVRCWSFLAAGSCEWFIFVVDRWNPGSSIRFAQSAAEFFRNESFHSTSNQILNPYNMYIICACSLEDVECSKYLIDDVPVPTLKKQSRDNL